MTDDAVVAHATARAKQLLDFLAKSSSPGNVVIQFHRDSTRIKKVVITTEESWLVPETVEIPS